MGTPVGIPHINVSLMYNKGRNPRVYRSSRAFSLLHCRCPTLSVDISSVRVRPAASSICGSMLGREFYKDGNRGISFACIFVIGACCVSSPSVFCSVGDWLAPHPRRITYTIVHTLRERARYLNFE